MMHAKLNRTVVLVAACVIATFVAAPPAVAQTVSRNAVGYVKITLYQGQEGVFFPADSFFDVFVETGDDLVQSSVGVATERNTVSASLSGMHSVGGLVNAGSTPFTLTGPMVMDVIGKGADTAGTWDTEIVSMSLMGEVPDRIIRESPSMQSLGSVTVNDLGGGLYHIDSFFDVFTELSVDGGSSWMASAGSTRFVIVPEPATMSVLGVGALMVLARRRKR